MQHDLQKHFRDGRMPVISVSRFINEEHSQNYAFFPHMHRDYLELFYVYHGNGRYMVGGKTYCITEGDIVICNAGVLHSKSCEHAKNLRSYSIGITNLALHLLPDNWLCSSDTMPILSCGSLSRPVGEIFRLVYLLSSDQQHLADICNCLAAALVLLTHELLQSRDKHKPLPEENETSVTAERKSAEYQRILPGPYLQGCICQPSHAVCDETPHRRGAKPFIRYGYVHY